MNLCSKRKTGDFLELCNLNGHVVYFIERNCTMIYFSAFYELKNALSVMFKMDILTYISLIVYFRIDYTNEMNGKSNLAADLKADFPKVFR